jgi:perosamine synthetase
MIPVYKPTLGKIEKDNLIKCIDSTWISSKGNYIEEFENLFSTYLNIRYATTVTNGTVALHLALSALGIGPGDEVIVPTLTYIASVNAITYTGAKPIFIDSSRDTWQMDVNLLQSKITKNTKAIVAVHLYGHPCEMDTLLSICKRNNLFLVEDCAEAIGTRYNNILVGSFGDISTFSFFGNKTITTGEGGMVVTNNEIFYSAINQLKSQGLSKSKEYWHDILGYNYRMTNLCASIGVGQMARINEILDRKKQIAVFYENELSIPKIEFHKETGNVYHSYWMCSILLEDTNVRDNLRKIMLERGIETRPVFYPIHQMPMYSCKGESYPNAEEISKRGMNLPSYPDLSLSELHFICSTIKQIINS